MRTRRAIYSAADISKDLENLESTQGAQRLNDLAIGMPLTEVLPEVSDLPREYIEMLIEQVGRTEGDLCGEIDASSNRLDGIVFGFLERCPFHILRCGTHPVGVNI